MNKTLNSLIIPGFMETLYMVFFSTVFAVLLGLPIGVLLLITEENHILPMKSLNLVLSSLVNIFRSLPFIILIIILFPGWRNRRCGKYRGA